MHQWRPSEVQRRLLSTLSRYVHANNVIINVYRIASKVKNLKCISTKVSISPMTLLIAMLTVITRSLEGRVTLLQSRESGFQYQKLRTLWYVDVLCILIATREFHETL